VLLERVLQVLTVNVVLLHHLKLFVVSQRTVDGSKLSQLLSFQLILAIRSSYCQLDDC